MNESALRDAMDDAFSVAELKLLCKDVEADLRDAEIANVTVDWDALAPNIKKLMIQDLIEALRRQGLLDYLVAAVRRARPGIALPAAPTGSATRESPAARARKEQILSELLTPMVVQLQRTERAFWRWNEKNLYLEARVIREGNQAILRLLTEKAHLIPPDLVQDAQKLVEHYDRWLEEYERLRGGAEPNDDEPFVFVGPKGYPFPRDAAKRFEERFAQLKEELGATLQGNDR